jgi:hypothetical protein
LQPVWDFVSGGLPSSCTPVTDTCPSLDLPTPFNL